MDAGFFLAEKLIDTVILLLDMREATIGNVERCSQLFTRAAGLKQTLEDPEIRKKLSAGAAEPVCLTSLLQVLQKAVAFVEKYGRKTKFGQFINSFNIESDFNTLDRRFTAAVSDFHLFVGMQTFKILSQSNLLASPKTAARSPSVDPNRKYDRDVIQALQEDITTSLVIRITPNIEQDHQTGLSLMHRLPGLWFLYFRTIEEFLELLKVYPILNSYTSRVRIISNRTLDNKTSGVQKLIDTLRTLKRPFPTMIYCSEEGVNELKALRLKDQNSKAKSKIWNSIFLTASQNVFENFALMSRLLWVDHNDSPENHTMQVQIQEQGIEVIRAFSTTEAVQWIKQNPGLQESPSDFRIMTNRTRPEGPPNKIFWNSEAGLQFIGIARNELKINSPALIFTAPQNVKPLQDSVKQNNYANVQVTAVEQEALKFCSSDEEPTQRALPDQLTGIFSHAEEKRGISLMDSKTNSPLTSNGKLIFEELSCSNLAPKDSNGLSDPYIVIKSSSGGSVKTMTIMKTLNPKWDTPYTLGCSSNDVITFSVWDWDLTTDDFEGQATYTLEVIPKVPLKKSLPLQPRPGKTEKVSGTVNFVIRFQSNCC